MRTLYWVLVVSYVLSAILRTMYLCANKYPRTENASSTQDAAGLITSLLMLWWVVSLM